MNTPVAELIERAGGIHAQLGPALVGKQGENWKT
jgi:hypothetical protein